MLIITEEQKRKLLEYVPEAKEALEKGDLKTVEELLDGKILELGFDMDDDEYWPNGIGIALERLYDAIHYQNVK